MTVIDKKYDVIIVGAGLIGASFALLLACRTELKIAVVERAAEIVRNTQKNQRVVALGLAARNLLTEVGVFQMLDAEFSHPYHKMTIWDENSDGKLTFSAQEHRQEVLGHIMDATQCTWLLQKAMRKDANIDLYFNFAAEQLSLVGGSTITSAEHSLTAKLVVAADGNRSWVRQQAQILADQHDYQQLGIVAKISTAESHQDTALQRFLEGGPLAVLPLAGNQSSIVWSVPKSKANELLSLSDDDLGLAIGRALDHRLGDVVVLSKAHAFPLRSQAAQQYFKRGVVLIGDAAHSIHPLAGQGANLGYKDATSLVEILESCEKNDLGALATLQRYQRARKPDNKQTDQMMSFLHAAYTHTGSWWLTVRGVGMNWVNASPSVKSILVKQAMGL